MVSAQALSSPCLAGDKAQSTMVDPVAVTGAPIPAPTGPLGGGRTNGTSKGQLKTEGITGIPDSDGVPGTGDEVISLADSTAVLLPGPAISATAVLRGEVEKGGNKIKVDLAAAAVGPLIATQGIFFTP